MAGGKTGAGALRYLRASSQLPNRAIWRRSLRTTTANVATTAIPNEKNTNTTTTDGSETVKADPVEEEFSRISKELPKTEEQKKEALKKIEDAYFTLGDIYVLHRLTPTQ